MSSSNVSCQGSFDQQVQTFDYIVLASIALTLLRYVAYPCVAHKQSSSSLAFFNKMAGCFKVLLGVLLYTVFWPDCPAQCEKCNFVSIYPPVAIFIGLLWLVQGFREQGRDQKTESLSAETGHVVFAIVPTGEDDDENFLKKGGTDDRLGDIGLV